MGREGLLLAPLGVLGAARTGPIVIGPLAPFKSPNRTSRLFFTWAGRDLNPHALRHTALNRTCLPVPPPALILFARIPRSFTLADEGLLKRCVGGVDSFS